MKTALRSGSPALSLWGKLFAIVALFCAFNTQAAVRTWAGGGTDRNWMTAANWVGNQLPQSGDDLVFPAGAARAASFNNFPAGTSFGSITVLSNTYQFTGAGITLSGGITASCGTNPSQVSIFLPITLAAPQLFSVQSGQNTTLQLYGGIDMRMHDLTFAASGLITVVGEIAGGGRLTKTGLATLHFSNGTNSYWGVTHVQQGLLRIYNGYGLGNASSETIIDAGAQLEYSNASVPVREPLILSGTLTIGASNRWVGPIALPGNGARIVGTGGSAIDGVISGPGGLRVTGAGPFYLNGDNAYYGLSDFEGQVVINGSVTSSSALLFRGSFLGGGGRVGNLTMTGGVAKTLAPGNNGVGLLTATRGLTLDRFTTVTVDLDSINFIDMRGSVNLANAKLQVKKRKPPTQLNQLYLVMGNDGTDPITGTFADLPEGAIVTAEGGLRFQITYGTGQGTNDVILRWIAPPTSIWDGGGADNLWTTGANWAGDVAPEPGDTIFFPDMTGRSTNFNDFPAGTTFHEIIVRADTLIEGNMVALNAGVQIQDRAEVALGIRLNAPQTIFLDDDSTLGRISGDVDNNGHTLTLESDEHTLEVSGRISGTGGLIVSNWGVVRLTGANTFAGQTEVREPATLEVGHPVALGSIAGRTIVSSGSKLVLLASSFSEPLRLSGTLSSAMAIYQGPIEARAGIIEGNIEIGGVISGDNLEVRGGTVVLSGANTYTGQLSLNSGTLLVDGNQPSGAISLNGGTLRGIGRAGRITSGPAFSTIAPGTEITPAALAVGDASLSARVRLLLRLNGPANYDALPVNGIVRLDNPQLAISIGYTPTLGQTFTIIENDGTDPVEGSFLYLMEGMTTSGFNPSFGRHKFQITYRGGDGNDVVLTTVADGREVRMWDGGGADARWTTASNWVGDVAPQPGDALGFAGLGWEKSPGNDFPADTTFDSITLGGSYYQLQGEPIRLNRGIVSGTGDANYLSMAIRLNSNQTFSAGGACGLGGPVDTAGHTLILDGSGRLGITGEIAGSGSIVKRGSGDAQLSGTNSYSGLTQVLEGTLTIDNPAALGTTSQPTVVAAGARLIANYYSFAEPVILAGSLVAARWTGPIETTSNDASLDGNIDGVISGSGGLRLERTGVTLTGNNTYTGPTLNDNGSLLVLGRQPHSHITQLSGALYGSGEVGPVTALGGFVMGGTSTNVILTTGSLLLRSPAVLHVTAYSYLSNHHQIHVKGTVALDQPILRFNTIFLRPALDQPMTIIDNDGTDPVAGTFAGLPEGRVGRLGTNGIYHITYTGGDGNDVVITRVTASPATILSLTRVNESVQITARGTPTGNYTLEAATNLNPVIEWISRDSRAAGSDGMMHLTDFLAPTNSMRFYRIRSRDF